MDEHTTPPGGDDKNPPAPLSQQGTLLPPANPEQFTAADLKEMVLLGINQWGDVTRLQAEDEKSKRQHEREMKQLEYGFVERENDAIRSTGEREDRRGTRLVAFTGGALLATFFVILFAGYAKEAFTFLAALVTLASGIGLGQLRPLRRLFQPEPHAEADAREQQD